MKTRIIFITLIFFGLVLTTQAQPDDEFFTGLEFNEKYDTVLAVPVMTSRSFASMPSKSSLKKYCPTPKNQGSQGSCVGWSSSYSARTILYAKRKGWKDAYTITSNAFSPSYVYNQIKLGSDCSQGSYISSAMNVLTKQGTPKLKDHPYVCNSSISYKDKSNASSYKIKTYHRLSYDMYDKNKTLKNVKKALSNGNPVVIGMSVYSSFSYAKGVWSGVQDNYRGGHAMTIIGYDDSKYGGAFELMNSWGSYWGNSGFIWVRYNDMFKNCREYYEMVGFAAAPPDPKPNDPDPQPVVEKFDLNGSFKLVKSNGSTMYATLSKNANRDFNIVKKKKENDPDDNFQKSSTSTYKLNNAQKSGTEFRIYITNNEPAYVYILGYGTKSGKVSPLYPFEGYSAYLGYKKSNVAIPNEDYYIALDNKKGKDYLCVLYSKKPLNIKSIARQVQAKSGDFNNRVKQVLGYKMVDGKNIEFSRYNVKFKAKTKGKTVLPLILEFDHI